MERVGDTLGSVRGLMGGDAAYGRLRRDLRIEGKVGDFEARSSSFVG